MQQASQGKIWFLAPPLGWPRSTEQGPLPAPLFDVPGVCRRPVLDSSETWATGTSHQPSPSGAYRNGSERMWIRVAVLLAFAAVIARLSCSIASAPGRDIDHLDAVTAGVGGQIHSGQQLA